MAAAIMRSLIDDAGLADRISVESAGTSREHEGQGADDRTVAALERHGYPSEHTARQFHAADFERFDLVLAFDRQNQRDLERLAPTEGDRDKIHLLLEFHPAAADDGEVPDPWYGGDADFDATIALVTPACQGLLDHLERRC